MRNYRIRLSLGSYLRPRKDRNRHRVDVYYDLSMHYAWPYLDGQLEVSLITDQDWSEPDPEAISVRLVGGQLAQFDNFVWKGGVDIFVSVYVPCRP